jgi:hypothetical protein
MPVSISVFDLIARRSFTTTLGLCVLLAAGRTSAEPLWCSPFETQTGTPVEHAQLADAIDNLVGTDGEAASVDFPPLLYVQYGGTAPAIPSAIDPANQKGSFAISTANDLRTGINTGLRSDAGDLATDLTFEGYFYMASGAAVTDPTFVARRLVTQKRSADDANSRLAIGVHAESTLIGFVDGLFDYEGFDYSATALVGQNGGTGWSGAWVDPAPTAGSFTTPNLSNDGVSLNSDIFPFTPVGSRFSATGGHISRPMRQPVNLSLENQVTFLSALMLKTSTAAASGDNLEIGLATSATVAATASTIRLGMTSPDQFFAVNSGAPTGTVVAGTPYFVILKIVSHASSPDQVFMNVYAPGQAVPTTEPGSWLISQTLSSGAVLTHLKLTVGANLVKGEVDEIRIGSTYESVIDPDAPIGNPGTVQTVNKLSVYWAEQVPGPMPQDPPTLVNHLEFGTTPLSSSPTWYHFALTYDGQDIRWYLDGVQQGQVAAPPATTTTAGLHPVGVAKMAVGNNRSFGAAADRGFFGLLDEIRIWDRALAPSEMLVQGGLPGADLLWHARFETNLGEPVTDTQPADRPECIDNSVGPPNGTPAGVIECAYVAFGQPGIPDIPGAIDPGNLGSLFALSMPEPKTTALTTNIPSNAGQLGTSGTIQGYFNTFETTPVGPTAVGSRLVSLHRSAAQNQVRVAIGLAAENAPVPVNNVLSVAHFSTAPGDPTNVVRTTLGTTPIQPNTWYHFALVYDSTAIRWYLNGVQEGELLAADGYVLGAAGTAAISIGNDGAGGTGTRGYHGLLDKIVVSDHVVAPSQFMTAGFDACLELFCNAPFADADDDDDVDMDDFARYQLCFTGNGTPAEGQCRCFDRDDDDDVDADDLDEFTACATRANVPWAPSAGCPE